ncbi:H(+)/Cl(-) exchange transporter 7-like [Clytia hemisphaerica]|uniref:Chloride channel protein n=1 Tax=Clytia hemisphaerica TaxID=252671 RepID=A0A7M5V549_9CNID
MSNHRRPSEGLPLYPIRRPSRNSEREPLLSHRSSFSSMAEHLSSNSRTPYTPLHTPKSSINSKPVDTPEYSGLSDIANHLEVSHEDPRQQIISSKFESLDYDTCENGLEKREQRQFTAEKYIQMNLYRWVIMLVIGLLTAFVAVGIDISIEQLAGWKYQIIKHQLDKCLDSSCLALPYAMWVCLNCAFVLFATLMVVYAEPVAAGSGIPQIKCYLNGVKIPHVVRIKTLITKVVGVVFSVAGGLAVGKEGPMIHTGAVIAAGISQGRSTTFGRDFHMFEMFRTDHEKRDFVAGGAAAGVAAAFGAPVGGVLFALEEGSSFWNQALTWRMFFSSMIASFTLNVLLSIYHGHAGNLGYPGLINFGQFNGSYQGYEIPLFMVMGVVGGLFGALFNAINHHLSIFRVRFIKNRPMRVIEALIVATMSSCVAFSLIYFHNDCRPVGTFNTTATLQFFCPDGEFSAMGTLVFSTPEQSAKSLFHADRGMHSIITLISHFCCYFILATWTYGLYVPSGLFVPVILCGAAMGRLFGECVYLAFPNGTWSSPGTYALIGAASLLGGVMRMTISLCVIVMEATGDITYGLPLMLCIIVAKWVGDFFNEGIYDIHIKLAGVPFLDWEPPQLTSNITMSQVMKTPVVCFHTEERVSRIIDVLKNTASHHNGFPVVDNVPQTVEGRRKTFGTFRGTILRSQLIILLKQKVFHERGTTHTRKHRLTIKDFRDAYPRFPPIRNINISHRERECYIDLRPFMNPAPYTILEKSSLNRGFRLFRALGLRHLVVVNENNQVIGIVTRKDLARYRTWQHRGQMGTEELTIMHHSHENEAS